MIQPSTTTDMDELLLTLLHSSTADIIKMLAPKPVVTQAAQYHRLRRPASAPTFTLKSVPTPTVVQLAMRQVDTTVVPEHRGGRIRPPRRPPVPGNRVAPRLKRPPTVASFQPPPRRSHEPRPTATRIAPPPPAPLDRMYSRGVDRRLEDIQGDETPLRERLHRSPGFANLPALRQTQLRAIIEAIEPRRFNGANAPALGSQTLRDVVTGLNLQEDSALSVEMNQLATAERINSRLQRMRRT